MTATLLLFLDGEGGIDRWIRLDANGLTRGDAAQMDEARSNGEPRVTAIVPGEDVALHWLELSPLLSVPQAAAAARLSVRELAAEPIEDLHIAAGRSQSDAPDARRCIAITSAAKMERWLQGCRAAGFEPDRLLPKTLLLLPPAEGWHILADEALPLARSKEAAFSAETDLIPLLIGEDPVQEIGREDFETGLPEALAAAEIDLRQGRFAKRRRWRPDWRVIRRLAFLGGALLAVTFLIQIALIWRYTFAADGMEEETRRIAEAALPGAAGAADPAAALARRATVRQGAGPAFASMAAPLFAALRDTANVEMTGLSYENGAVRATVIGDTPAAIAALVDRVKAGGANAAPGPLRPAAGRHSSEVVVRGR